MDIWEPSSVLTFMYVGILICAAMNFGFNHHQIVPIAGRRGLYPASERVAVWTRNFPLATRLLRSPMCWLPVAWSDGALEALTIAGTVAAVAAAAALCAPQPGAAASVLLFATWALHAMMQEIALMPFPWHSLISECLFLLLVTHTPLLVGANVAALGWLPSMAFRVLAFRVLFGFGLIKFKGATWRDIRYIKPFIPSIPVPSLAGLVMYRKLPMWFFLLGYAFFFLSEIVCPFLYFSPNWWHRAVAATFTIKLMIAIMFSGNFGNFNLLTAILAFNVFLPVLGGDSAGAAGIQFDGFLATLCVALLACHIIAGALLVPLNSWAQQSWYNWPSLHVANQTLRKITDVFEALSQWRIVQPYGIFPPNIFSAQRQVPVFEASMDGETFEPYKYKYQPQAEGDAASMLPAVHPWLDFCVFYQMGYWGFMKSAIYMHEPTLHFSCRPLDAIARNLLQGGDVHRLFGECPFPASNPPKFIRVVQVMLTPCDAAQNGGAWWKAERGQLELPPTSLATLHTLPAPLISDVRRDLDYAGRVWRQRVTGARSADQWDRAPAAVDWRVQQVLRTLRARTEGMSPAAVAVLASVHACETLADAVAASDSRRQGGAEAYERDAAACAELHEMACEASDVLFGCGWPFSGEQPADGATAKRLPTSAMQTYLLVLWALMGSGADGCGVGGNPRLALSTAQLGDKVLELSAGGPTRFRVRESDGSEVHEGLLLFATLFARSVRLEASLLRRMRACGYLGDISQQESSGIDTVLPGWLMYARSCIKDRVPFSWDSDVFGTSWGEEVQFHWDEDENCDLHVFKGIRRGDGLRLD